MPSPGAFSAERLSAYLTLRQMRVLVAVAEQGGVVKAAQSLHLAQPAISRSLHQLENALGMPLFDRSPRGMTLTVFGEALVRRVRTVFCELRDAGEELTSLQDMSYGRLSIGCTPLLTIGAMPRVLSTILAARPGLALSVMEGDSTTLLRELRLRNIDMALARLPPPASREPDLDYEHLYEEKLFLVSCPDRAMARYSYRSLADTVNQPWVLPMTNSMLYRVIPETFARENLPPPTARVHASSPSISLSLVATTDMITLMPGSILANWTGRHPIAIISKLDTLDYGSVGCMTLRAKHPTPAAKEFISILRTEIPGAVQPNENTGEA